MFKKFSSEQALRIVGFVFMAAMLFGVDLTAYGLTENSLAQMLVTLSLLVAMAVDFVGYIRRWTKGDVDAVGRRM